MRASQPELRFVRRARVERGSDSAAQTRASLGIEVGHYLDVNSERALPVDMPDLHRIPPELGAAAIRRIWGLGDRPIANTVELLERFGTRVMSMAGQPGGAMSFWSSDVPFVFVDPLRSRDIVREDCIHAFAELLMYRHRRVARFARALLMPREPLLANLPYPITPGLLNALRRVWGVTRTSLLSRLVDLGVMQQDVARALVHEPDNAAPDTHTPSERSRYLPEVLAHLRRRGITRPRIVRDLGITRADFEGLLVGLTLAELR